ncbi:MAG: N-acetylmuramic acid 6-phosphate etherase [Aquincola sp.]|nr:N-acetylmuramic acid 6-phosphate etherase [Aquincola sp.]MDH4290587.1 N-acetylmuramic acid 6-phosphate etherase [Aquincola sp.]MDH5328554.1 N-acetylmuramic acid 6-phosphate etherase [Aquincola sp.]
MPGSKSSEALTASTETPDARHPRLDRYATPDLVAAFVDDQVDAVSAVREAIPDIARAVDAALPRIQAGGRLIYIGAGTSGRLGVLDSVELTPTFNWPSARARALMAGGDPAMYVAVEGAEDDASQAAEDLHRLGPGENDVVICLAASGNTPYVLGALQHARASGALTIGIANNPGSPLAAYAEIGITLATGAEVISGSTRLKAGTAQKIALNTFSSALMVRLHKVFGNLMVDLRATNAKLIARAERLTMLATGCSAERAREVLTRCGWHIKTAIVAIERDIDVATADRLLDAADGDTWAALAAPLPSPPHAA